MLAYRMTDDEYYLDMAHECIEKTYESFGAGTPEQGLWYNLFAGYPNAKSLYCAGTILSALEYYDITKGTEKEDAELQEQTMGLYNWVETNLRRDHAMTYNGFTFTEMDYLYYNDFMVNSATIQAPNYFGQGRTTIGTGGSSSSFFGNTAMCVINKRLYELTGDEAYLDKALKTANAFVGSNYDLDGVLCNDRDAYTNCAFVGFFVREVLSLDGITDETKQLFLNTAKSILNNCYFEEGYYGSDWAGENKWTPSVTHGNPHCLTNNATTVHMIYAVCWAVQNGVIMPTYDDLSGFPHGEPLTEHPYPNYQE